MTEKSKSGAGKFILGAALGAVAGAIAGKFISIKGEDDEAEECNCGDDCKCGKCEAKKEAKEAVKEEVKAEKKAEAKKSATKTEKK